MRKLSATAQHALAAEYVLGTLRGRARQRFEGMAKADPALAAVVRGWEDWLTPLALQARAIEPPERVWKAIESRITPRTAQQQASGFWNSLAFWRGLGAGLAVLLVAFLTLVPRPAPESAPSMVAVLATPEQDPRMIVERHADRLVVRIVKPWKASPDQDLELWAVPKDGAPRSLGVLRNDGNTEVRFANLEERLSGTVAFAVSREPAGGSKQAGPSGPVVCSGVVARSLKA